MHGLAFKTSIWLLAGSTRFLTKTRHCSGKLQHEFVFTTEFIKKLENDFCLLQQKTASLWIHKVTELKISAMRHRMTDHYQWNQQPTENHDFYITIHPLFAETLCVRRTSTNFQFYSDLHTHSAWLLMNHRRLAPEEMRLPDDFSSVIFQLSQRLTQAFACRSTLGRAILTRCIWLLIPWRHAPKLRRYRQK